MAVITVTFRPVSVAGTSLPVRLWTSLLHAAKTARTRRLLAAMDDHLLADIGVTRVDAVREASRAMWDTGLYR